MFYLFPIANAYAQEAGGGGMFGTFANFIPFAVLIAIFYFLLIRPQQKGAKKHSEMLQKLEKGDSVITRGGIHGRIVNVKDDALTLEIADNVRVKVERNAIQTLKGKESA